MVLEWDSIDGATNYTISRATSASGPFTSFTNAYSPYTDTAASGGTPYYYTVQPTNGAEVGVTSAAVQVTAAAAGGIPPPLLDQLRPGGRMAIPVGGGFALQHLVLVDKAADGKVRTRQTLPVAFVPLVRGGG